MTRLTRPTLSLCLTLCLSAAFASSLTLASNAAAQSSVSLDAMNTLQSGDVEAALTISEKACNGGDAASCAVAGLINANPQFEQAMPSLARVQFQKACEGSVDDACMTLMQMRYGGVGGKVDKAGALKLAKAGCEKKIPTMCTAVESITPEVAAEEEAARNRVVALPQSDVAYLKDLDSKLNSDCAAQSATSLQQAAIIMNKCGQAVGQLPSAPYSLPASATDERQAVAHLAAGMANLARFDLYDALLAKGYMKQDKAFMRCMSVQSAESNTHFVKILARSNVSDMQSRFMDRYSAAAKACE